MKSNHRKTVQLLFVTLVSACAPMLLATTAGAQATAPLTDAAATAAKAVTAEVGTARMKPVRKTVKAPEGELGASSATAVTTGSLAKTSTPGAGSKTSGRCTRIAFEVNDYGKEGPTKDAKSLLDTHIAKWAAEKGIKKYTVGKKTVDCRLFLDFIVFDEHTCKAEAPVCW